MSTEPQTAQKERESDIGLLLILEDPPATERAIDRAGGTPPPPVPPAPRRRRRPERDPAPKPLWGKLIVLGLLLLCWGCAGVLIEQIKRGPR